MSREWKKDKGPGLEIDNNSGYCWKPGSLIDLKEQEINKQKFKIDYRGVLYFCQE